MKFLWILACLSLLLSFSGCSSPPPNECASVDWYELGRRQGTRGLEMTPKKQIPEACKAEFDSQRGLEFENGYMAGLVEFCLPEVGFTLGYNGQVYRNVCPYPAEVEFLAAFERGQEALSLESLNRDLEVRIDSLLKEIITAEPKDQEHLKKELEDLKRQRAKNESKADNLKFE